MSISQNLFSSGFELTFQSFIMKNCKKNAFVLMLRKGPQWLGLKDRMFLLALDVLKM